MKALFVDCPTGLAGDMLLAAFLDLGVPSKVINKPLSLMGLEKSFNLKIEEKKTFNLRGLMASVDSLEVHTPKRNWHEIRRLICNASLEPELKKMILEVFQALAEAEASVHGQKVDEVHFHEVGAIDSLVDVVGVCASVRHLNPKEIFCGVPPVGYGQVETSHGLLPVPVPAVLQLAKNHQVPVYGGRDSPHGELTTPTGLALMAVLASDFTQPSLMRIHSIGIGLGHRKLDRPNILRICEIDEQSSVEIDPELNELNWQPFVLQETWIDDSTPEDISALADELRRCGALDVICQSVLMKKGRQGVHLAAIVPQEKAHDLRLLWLSKSSSIGLRERIEGRWTLPRRRGYCVTPLGRVGVKQVRRPDGVLSIKPEHDELLRISIESGHSLEKVRKLVLISSEADFFPYEDWSW